MRSEKAPQLHMHREGSSGVKNKRVCHLVISVIQPPTGLYFESILKKLLIHQAGWGASWKGGKRNEITGQR